MLVETLAGDFDPSEFEDDYAEAVEAVVKAKIEGGEVKRTPTSTKTSGEVGRPARRAAALGRRGQDPRAPGRRAACYGVAIPYQQRHLTARLDSDLAVSAGQLICATLLMAVVAPLVAGAPPTHLSPKVIGSVLTLGAVGTGIALAIHARNIRWVGGSTASYVTYLSPMFAIAVGILVLGESLHWYQPVGGAVILLGVAIAQGRIRLGPRPTPVVAA
jgi:uncharacterized membrane protein